MASNPGPDSPHDAQGSGGSTHDTQGPVPSLSADEKDLLDAINQARIQNGVSPVKPDPHLMCAARNHVLDVGSSGTCGHVGSDGSWPWDRAAACGFPRAEVVNEIAAGPGFVDGAEAVWGWSQSPGHWAGLLHQSATLAGVGVHQTCYIAMFDCCVEGM
jgi:uncharacterized protein YkwD